MRRFLALGAALLLACSACGTPDEGELEVRVTDHREAIGDFAELLVAFSGAGAHRAGQPRAEGWQGLDERPSIDLTRYVEGASTAVVRGTVPAGAYDAVRLNVAGVRGELVGGGAAEVAAAVDSVALAFTVRAGGRTVVLVDLAVLDMADHPGRGYELQVKEASVVE